MTRVTIATAETEIPPRPGHTAPEHFVSMAWPHHRAEHPPFGAMAPDQVAKGVVAYAHVNHGRWIVDCPFCPGAQLASEGDHRFACVDCIFQGTKAQGRWIRVLWPDQRAEIEQLLAARPLAENRNWRPGESLARLRSENRAHGLPEVA